MRSLAIRPYVPVLTGETARSPYRPSAEFPSPIYILRAETRKTFSIGISAAASRANLHREPLMVSLTLLAFISIYGQNE